MKKERQKVAPMKAAEVARELVEVPDTEITLKVKSMLWSQFMALLPPLADPKSAVVDLIRLYTRQEYQRRMMEQYDKGML